MTLAKPIGCGFEVQGISEYGLAPTSYKAMEHPLPPSCLYLFDSIEPIKYFLVSQCSEILTTEYMQLDLKVCYAVVKVLGMSSGLPEWDLGFSLSPVNILECVLVF